MSTNNSDNKKLLSATNVSVDKKIVIEVDATSMDFNALSSISANDKGNRTVVYQKWVDVDTGITFQLTGYVASTQYARLEDDNKRLEALKIRNENEALKVQLAQFQSLMGTPEFKEFIDKMNKK